MAKAKPKRAARPKRAAWPKRAARSQQSWRKRGRRIRSRVAEESSKDEEGETVEEVEHAKEEPIHLEQLTPEQRDAAKRAIQGENLFLTGAAGTGKSFLLRYLIHELEQRFPEQVAVTASTGVAASHLAGQTLHSFAGIGIGCSTLGAALKKVKQNPGAVSRWQQMKVLVVDEISMIDADLLELISGVASNLRGNRAAFGGLQVLLCGDFLQLPPVQERGTKSKSFCFHAKAWREAKLEQGTILLRDAVRQQGDTDFAEVLNEMRLGIVSEKAKAMLESCHVNSKPAPSDEILPTKLYCLNRDVDRENAERLAKLPGAAKNLWSQDKIPRRATPAQRAALDRKVPQRLSLKVGAQVIHLCNDPAMGLVNGHRGCVEAFEKGKPVVRFDNGKKICIGVHQFVQGQGSKALKRFQVPLKLGWALTVHKAQGMTLTRAELQLDNVFEVGQSYVALSRLTGTQGLWIRGQPKLESSCRAHPDVLRFYEEAKQRSQAMKCSNSSSSSVLTSTFAEPKVSKAVELLDTATLRALPGPQGKRPKSMTLLERLSKRQCKENVEESPKLEEAKKNTSQKGSRWVTPLKHWCDPIEID